MIPDYAILDVTLRDGTSVAVARALDATNVPYLLHTGWPAEIAFASEFQGAAWLEKPIKFDDLVEALDALRAKRKQTPISAAHC